MTNDYVIGFSNKLPWRLSADLKRFRKLTTGQVVVMGRRTYESIGRPLPNRTNVVISRRPRLRIKGCAVKRSLEAALRAFRSKKIAIIGGGEVFREALPLATTIYLTLIEPDRETRKQPYLFEQPIGGDAYFPRLDPGEWKVTFRGRRRVARPKGAGFSMDDKDYPSAIYFRFLVLTRRKRALHRTLSNPDFAGAFQLPKELPNVIKAVERKDGQRKRRQRAAFQPDLFEQK